MSPWRLAAAVALFLPPTLTAKDECPWPRGHRHFCRDCGPCGTAEGDCDRDLQCRVGRTCSRNVGDDFGFPPKTDVCVPAASLIAFSECVDGFSQIFVAQGNGSGRMQLTDQAGHSWFPAWSSRGDRLAYSFESGGNMQVRVMGADGSDRRQLTHDGFNMAASWSPNGRQIAVARSPAPGQRLKIWIMNADGSSPYPLTGETDPRIDENVPRWSPDGQRIVFTSNRTEGRYEIWVADAADGGNLRALTTAYFDPDLGANIEQKVPAWSPDGRRIAYWSGVEATDPRPDLPRHVWVMDADGSNQRLLLRGDDPNWSPWGHRIIHSMHPDGVPALGSVRPNGTGARTQFQVPKACRPLQSSWTAVPKP